MMDTNGQKSSAELEREVNAQRNRVEARIGEIKDRLSPGQLIDEVLSYTKDGGNKFASNLGQQITANPLPAALVGVGLAWLISANVSPSQDTHRPSHDEDNEYPYAMVPKGGLKRVNHAADDAGQWWSEFETDGGARYKAKADSLGRRAGHFTDQTGKKFTGFIDEAGNRVRQFQDESGNMLDDAKGWASHNWNQVRHGISQQIRGAASTASDVGGKLGDSVQTTSDQMARQIGALFDQQPLIAGALAFAAGAALGAALPHTRQEDQLIGEQADKARGQALDAAGSLYDQGKQKAAEAYDAVRDKAGKLYGDAKDQVADLAGQTNYGTTSRH